MTSTAPAAISYIIKVPVHANARRTPPPAVAKRLRARAFPKDARASVSEKRVNEDALAASRKAAVAAAHNARVSESVTNTVAIKSNIASYTRETTDRRLQEAEQLRVSRLEARASVAKKFVQRVDDVAEKNESRKAQLAANIERKLELAEQNRKREIAKLTFKAADAAARAKDIALKAARAAAEKAAAIETKVDVAVARRDAFLNLIAFKAHFFNARADRAVKHAKANARMDAKVTATRLQSRMAAAAYLRGLDVRLRQSKAALTTERAAHVVERQRLQNHVSPLIEAARIRADQFLADERRNEAVNATAARAHRFIRRAVVTAATREYNEAATAATRRANLEEKLAAAAERKSEMLSLAYAGGGPEIDSVRGSPTGSWPRVSRASSPRAARDFVSASTSPIKEIELAARARARGRPSTARGPRDLATVFRPPSPDSPYYPYAKDTYREYQLSPSEEAEAVRRLPTNAQVAVSARKPLRRSVACGAEVNTAAEINAARQDAKENGGWTLLDGVSGSFSAPTSPTAA